MRLSILALVLALLLPLPATAATRDELVGVWVGQIGDDTLTMTLAADGRLTIAIDGEQTTDGTWGFQDGKLLLNDPVRPEQSLSCDVKLEGNLLDLSGAGTDCEQAPLFTRQS